MAGGDQCRLTNTIMYPWYAQHYVTHRKKRKAIVSYYYDYLKRKPQIDLETFTHQYLETKYLLDSAEPLDALFVDHGHRLWS